MQSEIEQKESAEKKKADITIRLTGKQDDPLSHLNPEQREAVTHKTGPILVIAGAGTGKTRVITERIAHILSQKWASSHQVLGLTFTEKAAEEMRARLDVMMPLGYSEIPIRTFHAFCDELLRSFGIDIGIPPNFTILEGVRQWQFLKEHLFEFELDYYRPMGNPTRFIDALVNHFGRLKEELISPMDYIDFAKNKEITAKEEDAVLEAKSRSTKGDRSKYLKYLAWQEEALFPIHRIAWLKWAERG